MPIIDLSHVVQASMPVYPDDPPVILRRTASLDDDGYTLHTLSTGMHAGTHVDLPAHLLPDTKTAADYSIDAFIGRGLLADVRGHRQITASMVPDALRPGDALVFWTGHASHWGNDAYFTDHAVLTNDAADKIVSLRPRLIGLDAPSPDHPPFPIHKALLTQGILLVENLCNLEALTQCAAFEFFAVPLRICAEACPVRAFARADAAPVSCATKKAL